ncbi:MAG: hypothetical protein AT710_09625 [Thermocladium sp. ECH_B]|nr:MAG: hypothetical protein AT710_09625 [Thermocladium sp. ECH_B]
MKPILVCVTGLLVTWVRGSTETIVATKTAAAINETTQTSLDLDHMRDLLIPRDLFIFFFFTPAVHKK